MVFFPKPILFINRLEVKYLKLKSLITHLVVVSMLFSCLTYRVSASAQFEDSLNDTVIQDFLAEVIPDNAVQIDNNIILNASRGTESIAGKVEANIYTFTLEEKIYTVVDFYSTEKINTSKDDSFGVLTNDYLLPLETLSSSLFVKSKVSDQWSFDKKLDTMHGLSGLDLYGSQINSDKPFVRILLCFLSEQNDEAENAMPEYVVTYNQSDTFTIPLIPIVLIAVLAITFIVIALRRKKLKNTK